MEQRVLGKSGLVVPVIGMGTWNTFDVHGSYNEDRSRAIVDQALSAGANFFDSSPMYGAAEQVLGTALEGRRDSALVATKVWARSRSEGQKQISRALRFFGGFVDLYQVHNLVNWQEQLTELERMKDAGVVSAIGITHYSPGAFTELAEVMKSGRITTIQVPYNPIEREVENVILPLAADLNLGIVVMRPFGEGSLMRNIPSSRDLAPLASFGTLTWAQVLLKWILSDPRCHVAIPATTRPERMKDNATAGSPPWFTSAERDYVTQVAQRTR